MLIKIRKYSIKKLKKFLEFYNENKMIFVSCSFSVKLIVFEKKIIEDQYSTIFNN